MNLSYLFDKNQVVKRKVFIKSFKVWLIVFFLAWTNLIYAEIYDNVRFEKLDNTNGLISDDVNCIHQDDDGFMWFGTAEGIVRYDGYEFDSFKKHKYLGAIYGTNVKIIKSDNDGNLYICSSSGFFAFSKQLKPIYTFATKKLKRIPINDIYIDKNKNIYISSNCGFYVIDSNKKTIHLVEKSKCNYRLTSHIVEDNRGNIWVGTLNNGILKLDVKSLTFTSYNIFSHSGKKVSGAFVNSIFIDNNGFLWAGVWEQGLYAIDIKSKDKPHIIRNFRDWGGKNNIPSNIVHCISSDQYGGIWVGTPFGAAVIKYPLTKHCKVYRYTCNQKEGDISRNIIEDIYKDSSNLLWFATKGGGVNKLYLNRNEFNHQLIPISNSRKWTQSICAFENDHKGRLLLGVLSLGFEVYDYKNHKITKFNNLPEYKTLNDKVNLNTVTSFLWDRDSSLWLGTRYNGTIKVEAKTGNINIISSETTKNFKGKSVHVQFITKDGLILCGTEAGLHVINDYEKEETYVSIIPFYRSSKHINSVNVTGIVRNYKGELLISTLSKGIFILKRVNGKYEAHNWNNFDDTIKILNLYSDAGGIIWIGTKGKGIKYIDKNSEEIISPLISANTNGDFVYGINQDNYGNMWFTTNHGLIKLWFEKGLIKTEAFHYHDGLQGNIFIERSFFKDKKGRFAIGGYNGFNIFDPSTINGNYSIPSIVITNLSAGGHSLPLTNNKPLILNHLNSNLSITFSALNYIYPEANQYAYMLKGIDKNWRYVNSKMRNVNYNDLQPGRYVFMVKGSNNQGLWNEKPYKLAVVVKPAPYKTWWAIIIYVIIIAGIIIFLFYQRLNTESLKQEIQLELIKKSRTQKLHDYKLKFFTNISHELLTPLSILSSVSENYMSKKEYSLEDNLIIHRNVDNLTKMIRQLLNFRKIDSGNMSLKLKNGKISEFIKINAYNFKSIAKKRLIEYNVDIKPNVQGFFDFEKLEIILHNLLSNAFKYTDDGGKITCSFNQDETSGSVCLIVEDNGKGMSVDTIKNIFNRFYRADKEDTNGGVGIGLNLTKNIIDFLHGEIKIKSEIGLGAKFTVILPLTYSENINEDKQPNDNFELLCNEDQLTDTVVIDSNTEIDLPKGKFRILVAEDNDDFRRLLYNYLNEYFEVIIVEDGKEALKIAFSTEIDLIVSDIMMPNLSGDKLCSIVKTDINLSHIPVILLTAKIGDKNRLLGYEAGADAYLEKPIYFKVLLIRIYNLIKQRQWFKNEAITKVNLEPENVTITSRDQKFIMEAKTLVEKNLSNSDFTVKVFAEELSVTNSTLYRKIRSLIGLSPNEFIRNIRLKRAAQMLENKDFTISEVAYNCGFNDLGYFGVCFKKMYGKTPKLFQQDYTY